MRIESLHSSLAYFPDLDKFWRSDDLAWTEDNIRAQLALERDSNTVRTIELLAQLARVRGLRGDLQAARALLGEAHTLLSSSNVVPATQLRFCLELGRMLALSMSPQKARSAFLQAWELAVISKQDFFAIDAAVMMSTISPAKAQNEWLQRARQVAEQSDNPQAKMWAPQLHMMQGWHAFDLRRYEEALLNFDAAIAANSGSEPPARLFPVLWGRARVLRALGQISEALQQQMSLCDQMQSLGLINGHVYLEIAECNQLLNQHDKARENFELAHGLLSSDGWYVDNRSDELDRMKYISKKRAF